MRNHFFSLPPPFTILAPMQAQPSEEKGRKQGGSNGMSQGEMDAYRELLRENICWTRWWRRSIRVAGNDFPQAVVKFGC